MDVGNTGDNIRCTADIVAAFLSSHTVAVADIPDLIKNVNAALTAPVTVAAGNGSPVVVEAVELKPAVPVKKSVTPDYVVCLEDGKKLKMLRRHLAKLNITPDDYRKKWGLPDNYPMVAPNYAKRRSDLAKQIGLGTKKVDATEATA